MSRCVVMRETLTQAERSSERTVREGNRHDRLICL